MMVDNMRDRYLVCEHFFLGAVMMIMMWGFFFICDSDLRKMDLI